MVQTNRYAKVYVHGTAYNSITKRTFLDNGNYEIVNNIQDCQICVWTGGEDINPKLYGEAPIDGTWYNPLRDKSDLQAVETAFSKDKFLVGICRGAQLLNVIPNEGKLWQDVDNHGGLVHKSFDCLSGQWVHLNSVHHQALRVTDEAQIICWALESRHKKSEGLEYRRGADTDPSKIPEKDKDIEVAWYPKTRSLCWQSHPEFGHSDTTKYFFEVLDKIYWGK